MREKIKWHDYRIELERRPGKISERKEDPRRVLPGFQDF